MKQNTEVENQVLFSQIPLPVFLTELRSIIREEIKAEKTLELQEKLLSPADTCNLFEPSISKVTLSKWTRDGLLQDYRIAGRVYYKYSEVIEAVKHLKRYKKA